MPDRRRLMRGVILAMLLTSAMPMAAGAVRVQRLPATTATTRSDLQGPALPSNWTTLYDIRTVTGACTRFTAAPRCTRRALIAACAGAGAGLGQRVCRDWSGGLTGAPAGWRDGAVVQRRPVVVGPPAPGQESASVGTPGAPARDPATVPATPADPAAAEDNVHGTSNDLLADNGLKSPWCAPGRRLNAEGRANCQAGGLASSGAGGDNASFDRHVDTSTWTGAPKIDRWFIAIILTILSFVWTLMVTLTRGVFTALEFAFSFNPLDGAHRGTLAESLRQQVQTVTRPLALLLAPVGAGWLMWTTMVARRPGHAASHAVLSCLLIVGGLVILANPIGTVGAALTASQRVGLAVIGTTAGQPSDGTGATQTGLQVMADGVIDQPLALLQFGDVDWGTNPKRLDPGLQAAAMALARDENPAKVAAVRAARTNLDLVQVWPANSAQRNAINDKGSLLRVLCGSDQDTKCKGPNAPYAEFRTERGAWQRALGLVVILLGLIPFWIALTFVAVKIIAAGLMSTVRLVQLTFLTPVALIGEHGNRRLTNYLADLVGNVLTAATYSFFLGLIMLMWRLITTWPGYAFVMQWLLLALVLWLLIAHRKSLWGTVNAPGGAAMGMGAQVVRYAATSTALRGGARAARLPRQTGGLALSGARRLGAIPGAATRRVRTPRPDGAGSSRQTIGRAAPAGGTPTTGSRGESRRPAAAAAAAAGAGAGAGGRLDVGAADAAGAPGRQTAAARGLVGEQDQRMAAGAVKHRERVDQATDLTALRARRARLGGELAQLRDALPARGRQRAVMLRRQASLTRRQSGVQAAINRGEQSVAKARAAQENPGRDRALLARRLDQQAALPRGSFGTGERRQYPQLTALIDASPQAYRDAAPAQRLRMRSDIDRELQRRTHARQTLKAHKATTDSPPPRRSRPADRPGEGASTAAAGRPVRPGPRTADERRQAFRRQARRAD